MLGVQGHADVVPSLLSHQTSPFKTRVLCSVALFPFISARNIFLSAVNGAPITCETVNKKIYAVSHPLSFN